MNRILNRLERIIGECEAIKAALLKTEKADAGKTEAFERFMRAYPQKDNHQEALEEWTKHIQKADIPLIMAAVESTKWNSDVKFIPLAWRWLRNKRWLDKKKEANDGKYKGRTEEIGK